MLLRCDSMLPRWLSRRRCWCSWARAIACACCAPNSATPPSSPGVGSGQSGSSGAARAVGGTATTGGRAISMPARRRGVVRAGLSSRLTAATRGRLRVAARGGWPQKLSSKLVWVDSVPSWVVAPPLHPRRGVEAPLAAGMRGNMFAARTRCVVAKATRAILSLGLEIGGSSVVRLKPRHACDPANTYARKCNACVVSICDDVLIVARNYYSSHTSS